MMNIPKHIAIVMDGNGRWAAQRNLHRVTGHRAGLESAKEIVQTCAEMGVEVLSLFTFSSENWRRPQAEVNALLDLLMQGLNKEVKKLHKNNVKIIFCGDLTRFSAKLQVRIANTQKLTAQNAGLKLIIAINYGGRWDILQAARKLAARVAQGDLQVEDIDEQQFQHMLAHGELAEPDLLIRTSGEKRISNFYLWQLAYTELYFTDTYWPDFRADALRQAIKYYSTRERRFGDTDIPAKQDKRASYAD